MRPSHAASCPCGSGVDFAQCCGQYLNDARPAPTAEALLRSRYSAYVTGAEQYLMDTWHPSTRPVHGLQLEAHQWIGLKILEIIDGQPDDKEGQIAFVARYKINGRAHRLQEISEFLQVDGRWFYVGGLVG